MYEDDIERNRQMDVWTCLNCRDAAAAGADVWPGDVFIDGVPMVDQGDLPWCSVASAARILAYYGIPCSLERLAQLFGTDISGTEAASFRAELATIATACGLVLRPILPQLPVGLQTLAAYNDRARRLRHPVLCEDDFIRPSQGQLYFDGERFFRSLDYDVWRSVLLEDEARFAAFRNGVLEAIDARTPLLWQVYLGLVADDGDGSGIPGAHTRIMLGYNADRKEILYTDSWGRAHAKKRMNLEDAFLITRELLCLRPG